MQENWKDVLGYEGLYQVSDLGRVKSMAKKWIGGNGAIRTKNDTILKYGINPDGYCMVVLCKNNKQTTKTVHRLVYESFNGKTNLQIDHKNEGNKIDNRLCNLQAISQRENISKYHLSTNKASKYTGVYWDKRRNKWYSKITINSKQKHLGCFFVEDAAHQAYQKALNELQIKV